MTAPEQPATRRLAESNRVEAFSDGVLAIAITLLVLDLHTTETRGRVGHDILAQWPTYLAYVASFLYIGVIWFNHHALFNRIARVDGGLLWCNLALLLPASVLPYPTSVLAFAMDKGTHTDRVQALILYAVVSSVMAVAWLVTFGYLANHPDLASSDVPQEFFRGERRRSFVGIVSPAVPIVIGLVSPVAALVAMIGLPVFYVVTADGLPRRRG
ncbi:hypothetical protein acdb102_47740 [Acidothermaceae bacterium B102]|nr:hypothetical protein acdb102_47740 [Acidothermaceae bacterium B102]